MMIKPILALLAALAGVGLVAMAAAPAKADQDQSFVASNGDDNNNCIRSAPCLSLGRAAQLTLNEGVINCLDSGPILGGAITRSMTVDCAGTGVMVLPAPFSSTAISVSNAAIIDVKIRGLTLNGTGTEAIGIDHQAPGYLFVEDCAIENFNASPGHGIREMTPTGQTSRLYVSDTVVRSNGLALSGGGIIIQPSGTGSARVTLERVRVEHNTYGIFGNGTGGTGLVIVQVRDSVAAENSFHGIAAFTNANTSTVSITVDASASLFNGGQGINAQGPTSYVLLANSTVMSNATGLGTSGGGGIFSYQNNQLTGNQADGAPTAMLTVK